MLRIEVYVVVSSERSHLNMFVSKMKIQPGSHSYFDQIATANLECRARKLVTCYETSR